MFADYYLFLIFIQFFVLVIVYGSYSYYKGKYEELKEDKDLRIDDLIEEIKWLHLNISEEKYAEFYRE